MAAVPPPPLLSGQREELGSSSAFEPQKAEATDSRIPFATRNIPVTRIALPTKPGPYEPR